MSGFANIHVTSLATKWRRTESGREKIDIFNLVLITIISHEINLKQYVESHNLDDTWTINSLA